MKNATKPPDQIDSYRTMHITKVITGLSTGSMYHRTSQ